MAVFPENMDKLDLNDTPGSFSKVENHIRYMQERVEFAMRNVTRSVSQAGVSSAEMYVLLTALQNSLSALNSVVNGMSGDITATKSQVGEIQAALDALDDVVEAVQVQVGTLQDDIKAAQSDISSLKNGLSTAKSDINALQNKTNALDTRVTALENTTGSGGGGTTVGEELTYTDASTGTTYKLGVLDGRLVLTEQ